MAQLGKHVPHGNLSSRVSEPMWGKAIWHTLGILALKELLELKLAYLEIYQEEKALSQQE